MTRAKENCQECFSLAWTKLGAQSGGSAVDPLYRNGLEQTAPVGNLSQHCLV